MIQSVIDDLLREKHLLDPQVDVIAYHHTWGREIRNKYGLWTDNDLCKELKLKTGLTHPDDMSHWLLQEAQRQANATRLS